jgi:hypothetical protein
MANTYELISKVTVGAGGTADITFSSIPSTYTDLLVKVSARNTASTAIDVLISFNGTTTTYSDKILYGSGSAAGSVSDTGASGIYGVLNTISTNTASTFSNCEFYIPNYASSNNKSVSIDSVNENNATGAYSYLTAGLWASSSAITSIKIAPSSNNFAQYSTARLYGIKNS